MRLLPLILLGTILLLPARAEAWSLHQVGDRTGAFLLGFASGYLAHETGHVIVAGSKGYNIDLDGPSLVYPGAQMSDADRLQVSSAGFQAQWLASEAAFLYRNRDDMSAAGDNFSAGVICSHLAITAAYLTVLNTHEQGDVFAMSEATGMSTGEIALLLAVPAALDAWRLFGDDVPDWAPILSVGSKGAGLIAVWTF